LSTELNVKLRCQKVKERDKFGTASLSETAREIQKQGSLRKRLKKIRVFCNFAEFVFRQVYQLFRSSQTPLINACPT
jgi:hypothetical protein